MAMPIYLYEREDGTRFEYQQPMSDQPLKECPLTHQPVRRIICPAAVHFKGQGFHSTRKDAENAASK